MFPMFFRGDRANVVVELGFGVGDNKGCFTANFWGSSVHDKHSRFVPNLPSLTPSSSNFLSPPTRPLGDSPKMPAIYYIGQTIHGCNSDELTLLVRWNGSRMVVNMDRNLSSNVMENSLIDKYLSACLQEDEDEEDAARDKLLDAINEAGQALLDQLAPPSMPESTNLHSVLFPPQFSFILVTVSGELKLLLGGSHQLEKSEIPGEGYKSAVPIAGFTRPHAEPRPLQFHLEVKEGHEFPRHQTTDIWIVEKLLGDGYISHVSVGGREMCAKVGRDFDGGALQREFDCLCRISTLNAQEASRVNVPTC